MTSEPIGDGPIPLGSLALVIEVADATLDSDLGRKAALYARHGVPEYWVADVTGRVLHQLWRPEDGTYMERRLVAIGDPVAAATIPALRVETAGL